MIEDFLDKIKCYINFNDIQVIFDLGSRDCLESINFADKFKKARIYAFEPNPETIKSCYYNSRNYVNIQVIPKAVTNFNGNIDFYPIDMENSPIKNIGASSLYPISELYHSKENLRQKHIIVPCIRLDAFCEENNIKPDLIWCDCEGSELPALEGLGEFIKNVKAIYVETTFQPLYVGNKMFEDLNKFMISQNFKLIYKPDEKFRGDILYLNKNLS